MAGDSPVIFSLRMIVCFIVDFCKTINDGDLLSKVLLSSFPKSWCIADTTFKKKDNRN